MAAGPALHIFPPVEEVNKRRESLDDLIRRSMDMRPTGPWPIRVDSSNNNSPITRPSPITKPTTGGLFPSDMTGVGIAVTRERSPSPAHERLRILPPIEEAKSSPRENPFQKLPPIATSGPMRRNPSVARGGRPRRSSSATRRERIAAGHSPARRRAPSPGGYPGRIYDASPISDPTPVSAVTPVFVPERDTASRSSNRSRVCVPGSTETGEVASITSPITYPMYRLERRTSSQASNRPIQRHVPQASNRNMFPPSPDTRQAPTPVSAFSDMSPSTTLVRSASIRSMQKPWTPVNQTPVNQTPVNQTPVNQTPVNQTPINQTPINQTPVNQMLFNQMSFNQTPISPQQEKELPIRSMFPVFNPNMPMNHQNYRPHNVAPLAMISPEKVNKPQYSPTFENGSPYQPNFKKVEAPYITPASDLGSLWATANGQLTTPDPKNFTLKMFRQDATKTKKDKICFGSSEDQPFYSLSKTHTITEEGEDHELLIQRHSTSNEDILPVSHIDLTPPPAPTMSKSSRESYMSDIHTPAQHVTTITPILATLHALDSAAKTPQAHTIALVDPNATSPAAAKLAERAVKEATERESCTLAWTATDPKNGKYELHHPSLGVFTIATTGDIKSAVEKNVVKGQTSISIINPFASLSPLSNSASPLSQNPSPISAGSGTSTAIDREPEIIARLDFQEEAMHLDAASIQQLGNLYLIDVCVSALLSVAIAEAKRAEDPGLVFDAPPPSLLSVKGATSKKVKNMKVKEIKPPKPVKKARKPRPITIMANSLGLGFEHLADEEDLPKITKGILSLLGFSFKTAVYLLGMGVKVTAAMVIGITRMATKD